MMFHFGLGKQLLDNGGEGAVRLRIRDGANRNIGVSYKVVC
jgi:hypothetical protein